ncbi:MAG: iron ABC transporter permease [Deferrisomatales bacterium]|nr:iron ABC transporter permease [Deferrisomatales bacterium]
MSGRRMAWGALLVPGLVAAFALALGVGATDLSPSEVVEILFGNGADGVHAAVVMRVRLPRALLAALVGGALSVSGAAFQATLRNPLADPYLLGVSGGAALGAGIALVIGGGSSAAVPAAAFAGALAALAVVYVVARAHQGGAHTLILSGVMVGTFCSAGLLFLLWTLPADPSRSALFWLAGDLGGGDVSRLGPVAVLAATAFAALWVGGPSLDLLSQGEATASDLGLDVGRTRLWVFAAAGLLTAAAVAMAGLVGFVGLVVPHAVRVVWGPTHRRLLPAAAVAGAAFLLLADAVARRVLAPAEVPVGVVTALVGAPFFLMLLRRRGGKA